ncbi:MAG: type II toxin-antitoxin system PemK/MazF family toxin [Methylobacterium sp.]|jgi:mRNA interferase MazF|nr:type II toxin-antitoxin system PemK/MazF family toxin [Methylobacterium sp.]
MKRGSVWTLAGGSAYTGKPRPVVVVQDSAFDVLRSITVCPLTSELMDAEAVRPRIEPSVSNGLRVMSQVMTDKIVTVPRERLGAQIGAFSDQDMLRVNRALVVFLGIGS